MTNDPIQKFKDLLDNHYDWPAHYSFKFIVKTEQVTTVLNYFEEDVEIVKKPSKQGRYISLTITKLITTSDEIIKVYQQVEQIEGIIRL